MKTEGRPGGAAGSAATWLLLVYASAVVYGTLFPVSSWRRPPDLAWSSLLLSWPANVSTTDVLTNLIIYLPIGLLWVWRRPGRSPWMSVVTATLVGTGLSYSLECVQLMLPRVSSSLDLLCNGLGTLAGAVLGLLVAPESRFGVRANELRRRWFAAGPVPDAALATLALWGLSQCAPFVPSADFGHFKDGIRPLWSVVRGDATVNPWHALQYASAVLGLGLLAATVTRGRHRAVRLFLIAIPMVLVAKIPILTRQLSAEAIVGAGAALAVLPWLVRAVPLRISALISITAAVLFSELRPGAAGELYREMNWIPLGRHHLNLYDFIDLVGGTWPFVGVACLARMLSGRRNAGAAFGFGGVVLVVLLLGIELQQQRLVGRIPDVTDVLVGVAAWSGAWWWMSRQAGRSRWTISGADRE